MQTRQKKDFWKLNVSVDGLFSFDNGENAWSRSLKIDGKDVYDLGNYCGTCDDLFRRVKNAKMPLSPSELDARLAAGLTEITDDIVESVRFLLPAGDYLVGLLPLRHLRLDREYSEKSSKLKKSDYRFQNRILRTDYYSGYSLMNDDDGFEIEVPDFQPLLEEENVYPIVAAKDLDAKRIEYYRSELGYRRFKPTALALSIANGSDPGGSRGHFELAHFLLDGHHKIKAASEFEVGTITLLSFLNLTKSQGKLTNKSLRPLSDYSINSWQSQL